MLGTKQKKERIVSQMKNNNQDLNLSQCSECRGACIVPIIVASCASVGMTACPTCRGTGKR